MCRRHDRWRLFALVGALAIAISGCSSGGSPEEPDEQASADDAANGDASASEAADYCAGAGDRNLVWAHGQEPPDLHVDDPANSLAVTSWVRQSLLEGLYGVNTSLEFVPELLAQDATVTELDDGRVRLEYVLRDGLTWSDGTPLTSEDVHNTYEILMEGYDRETDEGGVYLTVSRLGYDQIDPESWELHSDTEFSFEMEEFFAGYPGLFETVFPAHVIPDAATANEAWLQFEVEGEVVPSSGPMVFDSWDRAVSMELVRNDRYHGAHPDNDDVANPGLACVPGVTINFVEDPATALRAGEADFIMENPQVGFAEQISNDERFTAASLPGSAFEQLSFNLANDHLADPLVREALAYAVDKSEVMARLYTPLFGDALDPDGLGNTYWLTGENYVDHQAAYDGAQVDEARAALEEAGYTPNADGIYEHPERGPLSLRISTTGDDDLRVDQQTIIVEQALAAGIELTIENLPFPTFFEDMLFSPASAACTLAGEHGVEVEGLDPEGPVTSDCHTFDIAMFSWVGGPWPGGQHVAYLSDSPNNPHRFASAAWDERAAECDATVDQDERAACYNELARWVTTLEIDPEQGLVTIPITTKPYYYAFATERLAAAATVIDANSAGPLVYVVDFKPVS